MYHDCVYNHLATKAAQKNTQLQRFTGKNGLT